MPAVNPEVNVNVRKQIRQDLDRLEKTTNLKDLFEDYAFQTNEPIRIIPKPKIQVTFEQELADAIGFSPPKPTKSGVNGSFLIIGRDGKAMAVFKPMNMETGMPRNPRMDRVNNVQFRKTIQPGQGVGNEVLAYYLDHYGFAGRYGIAQTILVNLGHPHMSSVLELGSAQRFIAGAQPLGDMSPAEVAHIPPTEWEKLNFRLITGSTDAHLWNILYSPGTRKIHLIDSGDDFVGADGQCQYYNPWVKFPMSSLKMSDREYQMLANINLNAVMTAFDSCARSNEAADRRLMVSNDKYLTQLLRLYLARVVGEMKLTQNDWFNVMTPFKTPDGVQHRSAIEKIYDSLIRIHDNPSIDWREIVKRVEWSKVLENLKSAARFYVDRRALL